MIYPINTNLGFSVGYDVCKIILPIQKRALLRFEENQLPKEYTFEEMSKVFMSKKNKIKAKMLKVEIINDRGHYDY